MDRLRTLAFNLFKNINKVNDDHVVPNNDSYFGSEEMSTGGKMMIKKCLGGILPCQLRCRC